MPLPHAHLHNIHKIFGVAVSDKFLSPKPRDFTKHILVLLNPDKGAKIPALFL